MTLAKDIHASEEPHDELTRLANDIINAANVDDDTKIIVMVTRGDRSGIGASNYEDTNDAFVDLLAHVEAMAKSAGLTLSFLPLASKGRG